jgi:hypothetical protein
VTDAAFPTKVKIKPNVDDFDPGEAKAFVMLAAFSNVRTDLLQDYIGDAVTHIKQASDDDARKYLLASLMFSRCK